MVPTLRALLFVLGMTTAPAGVAVAQAPSPTPVVGAVYSVIYVEGSEAIRGPRRTGELDGDA